MKKRNKLKIHTETKEEKYYIESLLDVINHTEIGKELINKAGKKGTQIYLEEIEKSLYGYSDDKDIHLNLKSNHLVLLVTILHELRHISQKKINLNSMSDYQRNMAMQIAEADARAAEIMLCYELAQKDVKSPLKFLKKHYPEIKNIFKKPIKLNHQQLMNVLFLKTLYKNNESIKYYKNFITKENKSENSLYNIEKFINVFCIIPVAYRKNAQQKTYINVKHPKKIENFWAFNIYEKQRL